MSTFNQVVNRMCLENTLFSATLELTYSCNLDCKICYNDVNLQGKPLSADQYLALLKELQRMGVMNITLTGGEPLAHPDFFLLGSKAKKLGFIVRVKTNGHALRENTVRRIQEEIDPFNLDISLHGACADTHDRQTRVPGSFNRLMDNFATLRRLGMRFKLNTPVTIWNESELDQISVIADELDVKINFDGDISPMDDGDRAPLKIRPSSEGLLRIAEIQHAQKQRLLVASTAEQSTTEKLAPSLVEEKEATGGSHRVEKSCGAGSNTILVDPFGTVYPCVQWRVAVGSLHDNSIMDIWKSSSALHQVREQATQAGEMLGKTTDALSIGFCAGRAKQESGSAVRLYPLALLRGELNKIVSNRVILKCESSNIG